MVEISGKEMQRQHPVAWTAMVRDMYNNDSDLVSWVIAEAVVAWEYTFAVDDDGMLWSGPNIPGHMLKWVNDNGWMDGDDIVIHWGK